MSTPVKADKKIEKAAKKKLKEWEQEQKKEQKKLDKQRKKGELTADVENDRTTSLRSSSVSVPNTPSRSVSYQSSIDFPPPKDGPTLPISAALDQLFDKDDQIASQEEDSFLTALVVETEIEPAVKAVFESGKEKEYVNKLDQYIIRKEKEIEDICSRNYQTFISAVDELLQVRAETEDLKENTVKLDADLQQSGKFLMGKYRELMKHRRMQYNMALAVEVVQDCQYLLSLIAKVNECLAAREFYPALRYLEHLQKVHLPRVQGYSFVQYFQNMIPIWEDQIRKGALDDANNWLLSLRDVSSDVGKFAFEQTEAQIKQEESIQVVTENGTVTQQVLTKKKSNMIFKSDFVEESLFQNSRFKVDFSALHQCMHIYSTMGIQNQFEAYYRDNRKQQANSVLKPRERIQELSALKPYFYKVCGFYVIEATVYQTANNLMPRSQLDKMWEQAVVTIKSIIQEQMAYTIEPDIIFELKEFVVLFCKTVQSYSYNIAQLFDFIETMKEAYVELSVNKYNTEFVRVLDAEKWEPLTINDKKEYETLILANKLQVNNEKTMPQSFIFTKLVPMYSNLLKSFISDFYKFGKGLQSIDEYVKKAAERLIKMYTQGLLSYTEHSTAISQLGLAWTNLLYLEVLCKGEWEDYLAKYSHHGKLKFLHSYEQSRKQVEGWIHDAMKKKMQEFASLAIALNWIPAAPVTEPRDYVNDLILFMDTSFSVLHALSTNVQEAIQTKAVGNAVASLMDVLLNDQVKNWNTAGIKALELEVAQLEKFAEKTKVTNQATAEIFGEMKQLLNLLGQDVLDGFLDPAIRKQQYSKLVDYPKLLKLLEKYREDRGYFTRKTPKEKSIDTVKEYLRKEIKNPSSN